MSFPNIRITSPKKTPKKENKSAYIAIIYMADSIVDYKIIEEKIKNVLTDLATVIENKQSLNPTQSIK